MIRLGLIFLSIVFIHTSVLSQVRRDTVFFKTEHYEGIYSEVKEQPIYIKYRVRNCDYGYSRKGLKFYTNDSIYTSNDDDYYKNVWDKGHMVPAASQNCTKEMIKETFSYLNCALQHQDLNRKVWKYLEEWERQVAEMYSVNVEIYIEFKTNQRLRTGATIPSGFYKTIYLDDGDLVYRFYFPNRSPHSYDFKDYKIKNSKNGRK